MAARPKLTPEEWAKARKVWEGDSRTGYAWLVKELNLPVSGPAVRKAALSDKWSKKKRQTKSAKSPESGQRKKVSKVFKKTETKVSETFMETLTPDKGGGKHGRPTKYLKEYAEQAYKLCLLGYIDKELADFFDVTESTINLWKIEHRSFSESIRNGKVIADATAADRLFSRVNGYKYKETKTKYIIGEEGKEIELEKTVTEKELPPDVKAIGVWLNNRQPGRWRDAATGRIELDGDKLRELAERFDTIMANARERQIAVLTERGILIDGETGRPVDG